MLIRSACREWGSLAAAIAAIRAENATMALATRERRSPSVSFKSIEAVVSETSFQGRCGATITPPAGHDDHG